MKKWFTHATIAVYLAALSWGIVSHAVSYGTGSHPVMYYLVWDMFCGWSSYSNRTVIIGQGESGRYYELAPGPWGEFRPFGKIGRRHYDSLGIHSPKLALNALRQTRHEPITRIIVVEECWAKQYNLPEELWAQRHEEPKDVYKYHQVRHIFTPDGAIVRSFPTWLNLQYSMAVSDNPRLMAEQHRGEPFFVYRRHQPRGRYAPGAAYTPDARQTVGSRLGNGN